MVGVHDTRTAQGRLVPVCSQQHEQAPPQLQYKNRPVRSGFQKGGFEFVMNKFCNLSVMSYQNGSQSYCGTWME